MVAVGDSVTDLLPGTRVAIDPGLACRVCPFCLAGQSNLCMNMKYLGSASTVPPVNGLISEMVQVDAQQCHPIPPTMTWEEAALVEPIAVAVHATQRSGQVLGTRTLVIGAGPIGLLLVQVLRASGARFIAVCDLLEDRCCWALKWGADKAFVAAGTDTKGLLAAEGFDVVFEVSGAPEAYALALEVVRRGGTVVQVGSLPAQAFDAPHAAIMTKELNVLGSFRFSRAFETALSLAATGKIQLAAVESRRFGLDQAAAALECAASGQALKVHISFGQASA